MWLLLVTWLAVRDMGGQLRPMGLAALVSVGVVSAGFASLLRIAWCRLGLRPVRSRSMALLLWGIPTVTIVILGLSLSIEGTGTVALALFWILLGAEELAWWRFAWRQLQVDSTLGAFDGATRDGPDSRAAQDGFDNRGVDLEGREELLSDDVSQQMTRSWAEEERDTITGLLRTRFDPQQRSQSLHVAICPPMLRRPTVTVTQLSGSRARIKAAEVQPFGIRFDVRLSATSEAEQDLLIHFEACCGKPEASGVGGMELR